MEFTIKQNRLKDELGFVQGIIEKKSTIPVLSNILIESIGEDRIRFYGTDLDVSIICETDAEIKVQGALCVQARKLFDIVRLLPNGSDVHFKKENNCWATVKCEKSNFKLAGSERDSFPEMPSMKAKPLYIPADIFHFLGRQTSYAITNEQSRFTLSGAKFEIQDSRVRMVATDGHRLSFCERDGVAGLDVKIQDSVDTLIPKKALSELLKWTTSASGDESLTFGEDTNHLYFSFGTRQLICRKLTGQFPNYQMVIPKDNDKVCIFDAKLAQTACQRVAQMADERTRRITLTVKNGEILLNSQSSEEGEADESFAATTDGSNGDEIIIGFQVNYLQDVLTSIQKAESKDDAEAHDIHARVQMEYKDANAQIMFRAADQKGFNSLAIIMPLRH